MNTRQRNSRITALQIELEHAEKIVAYHQERLVLVPEDCLNQEIWEEVEMQGLKAWKVRERRIRDEIGRLQGQLEFSLAVA